MGKPTGFMEYAREPKHERAPLERIKDWSEAHPSYGEDALRKQGARCMDCGVPFCHTGKLIAGMASGCPVNNLIPAGNDLVYSGQWEEAYIRLAKTNNFPEFTGRVCPAPCEGSCTLGINEPPVTIKLIECEIVDRAFAAGLACAQQLNRAGHLVTVFERADRVGGLLMYGIPNMKLDKSLVERRAKQLADEGVRFVTDTEIGRHIPADRVAKEYDSIVLCGGATQARDLPVEGRNLQGIHLAMDFLTANTKSLLDSKHADGKFISAKGKHVVVIGGGDTGTDCVGTSIRHGASGVVELEILARPPDERAADNPWPQWPKTFKSDYGQDEAKALWGKDPRDFQVLTNRFVDDGKGNVKALEVVTIEWTKGPDGRFGPKEVPGSGRTIPADLVFLALGFVGPEKPMLQQLGVKLDDRGNVWTDENKMTSVPGVFAAGDMSRGQSLVVWAIREGRQAAQSVDRYLVYGDTVLPP